MTTADFVAATILKATGEVSTSTSGDDDWNKLLGIGNYYIDNWSNETGTDWNSLYNPELSFGTITATDTFAIPTTVRKLSDAKGDVVRVDNTDGTYTEFEIVPADSLKRYYGGDKSVSVGNYCAQIGSNLVFNRSFTSDDKEFGGALSVPVYTFPTKLVADTDVVPVDIPNWLVTISAAEWVRNDITKQNQYPNLVAEANEIMQRMKDDNENAQVQTIYRVPVARGIVW